MLGWWLYEWCQKTNFLPGQGRPSPRIQAPAKALLPTALCWEKQILDSLTLIPNHYVDWPKGQRPMKGSCISQGSPERQNKYDIRHRYRYIEREREIYYKKLAHAIMETEKAQDLQSASWRPRRVGGIVPVWAQRLRTQESQWYMFQPKGRKRPMSQLKESGRQSFLLSQPFCSIQVFNWLDEAHPH